MEKVYAKKKFCSIPQINYNNMFENEEELVDSPIAYIISSVLCVIWLLMILSGPLFYSLPLKFLFIADMYYYLFHFTCHQIPSRCYWILGYQLPVCVRCFGIYFGAFIALLIYPMIKNVKSLEFPRKIWLIPCFLPMIFEGVAKVIHLYPSPHWLRLTTGMLCGGIAIFFILPGFNEAYNIITKNKD